jgi:hypothetical protein
MALIELTPLNEETIQKLGLGPDELWMVKLNEEIHGPFDGVSLSHYCIENEELFDQAEATQMGSDDWQYFYSHPLFQRRGPQLLSANEEHQGPYWLLDLGQKVGPLTKDDLEKKLELGSIGLTQLISIDEGHSWKKLYHIEGFNRRLHSSSELPFSPSDSDFQRVRLELIEKLESQSFQSSASEQLAEMAHSTQQKAQVLPFSTDNVPLRPAAETAVSTNLRWQLPLAVAAILIVVLGFQLFVTSAPEESTKVASASAQGIPQRGVIEPQQNNHVPNPSLQQMPVVRSPVRQPANFRPQRYTPPPAVNNSYARESQFPTHMETHQQDNAHPEESAQNDNFGHQDIAYGQDNFDQEGREPAVAREQSLVGSQPEDHQSLDSVMGNDYPVEEVSDF